MKVTLINPPKYDPYLYTLRDEICFQNVKYIPFPMRLAQIAGMIKDLVDLTIIDANALGYDYDTLENKIPQSDVVIFQSSAGLIKYDSKVAEIAKKKFGDNVKTVIIENTLAPIYPERFLKDFQYVDIIIRGQIEIVIPDLIKKLSMIESRDDSLNRPYFSNHYNEVLNTVNGIAFRDGENIICTSEQTENIHIDNLPFTAYQFFPMSKYSINYLTAPLMEKVVPGIHIRTTRDCPYHCPFCIIGSSIYRGYNGIWKAMSPQRVVDEIEYLYKNYNIKNIFFWDETFTLDRERTINICKAIIKKNLKINWRCLTRIDRVDKELLEFMSIAGCKHIEFGLESGDKHIRDNLNKKFSDDDIVSSINITKKAGIRVSCDLIIGLPDENRQSLQRTLNLAKRILVDYVHLTVAFPYPETEIYNTAIKNNLLEVDDIYDLMINTRVRVGAKAVMKSNYMSASDIETEWKKIRKEIDRHYRINKIILRPWVLKDYISSCKNPSDFFDIVKRGVKFLNKFIINF